MRAEPHWAVSSDNETHGQRTRTREDSQRLRLRDESLDPPGCGVPHGHVPRLVDVHLGHDAVRKQWRWGKPGQTLDGLNQPPLRLQFSTALLAFPDVRLERRDTEAGFAVEELVDLVRK